MGKLLCTIVLKFVVCGLALEIGKFVLFVLTYSRDEINKGKYHTIEYEGGTKGYQL